MQKLFVLLRQGKLEEIKEILAKKPEEISSVSGPKPKKDHGQSLLQVAFKSGQLDIAEYLIDEGIDVNFMEAEDDDLGMRAPVIMDAITAAIDCLCLGEYRTKDEVAKKFKESDKAIYLIKKMISLGADVNIRTSNGLSSVNWALHHAENIMDSASVYPYSQEKVREQLTIILDCLFENGVDKENWLSEGFYPEPHPGSSIKEYFFQELDPSSTYNERYMQMRLFVHEYVNKRKML